MDGTTRAPAPDLAGSTPGLTALDAPVQAGERLNALDILRGFALLGMILVHFHQRMRLDVSGPEDLIGWFVWVGVEQKSWGTFAFLFGVGFAILLRRLEARGRPVAVLYLRRLCGLAVFGLIAEIGFGFSILLNYAMWGLVLLVVRKWSTRALLTTAVLVAMARPLLSAGMALHAWYTLGPDGVMAAQAAAGTGPQLRQALEAAQAGGSYWALASARWAMFLATETRPMTWLQGSNFPLFIVGLLAVRHGVLDQPLQHLRLIRGWMGFGFLSWALSWTLLRLIPDVGVPGVTWTLQYGMGLIQDQWLCFFYIGAVVLLLAYRPGWERRLSSLGMAGRMALTNYMVQAATLDYLASGYGAALKIRPLHYLAATVLLFVPIALASSWWLQRYRFGPLEWVWRSFTYWRTQPMRRAVEGGIVQGVA